MAQAKMIAPTGAANGLGIKVAATGSPGTTLHTATSSTNANTFDEIDVWAVNTDTSARTLTIQWGGTTAPDNSIPITLAPSAGLQLVVSGLRLQNSLVVRAFASAANVVVCYPVVNSGTA